MTLGAIGDLHQLTGLAIALALGLLAGVQRGWAQRDEAAGTRFAGVRTNGLLGLAGGVGGVLAGFSGPYGAGVMVAAAALVLIGYWRTTQRGGPISGTASVAGLLTLCSRFLAATGATLVAVAIGVSMMLLLAMRSQLHGLVARLSEGEVLAVARFALIAAVILPLLPDRQFEPLDAWNPRQLPMALVMATTLAARWVLSQYGDAGLATALALTGSIDVDSAIITMGNLPTGSLTPRVGALVLVPPILLNTLFKTGALISIAGWRRTWPAAVAMVVSAAASLAALPLVL